MWREISLGFVSTYVLARQGEAGWSIPGSPGAPRDRVGSVTGLDRQVGHVIFDPLKHADHVGSVTEVLDLAEAATGYAGADDIASITAPRPLTPVGDGGRVFRPRHHRHPRVTSCTPIPPPECWLSATMPYQPRGRRRRPKRFVH